MQGESSFLSKRFYGGADPFASSLWSFLFIDHTGFITLQDSWPVRWTSTRTDMDESLISLQRSSFVACHIDEASYWYTELNWKNPMASGCSLLQRHCGGSFPWYGCLLCFGLKWWLCKGACHWRSCSLLCPLEYLSGHSLSTSFIGFSSMWRHQVTGESNGLLFCHHRCMMKISLGFSAHSSCLWCDIFMQCNGEIFEELVVLAVFRLSI